MACIGFETADGHRVSCGRCYECRVRRMQQWAFRLMEEYRQHKEAYFVTFTYDPENVPRDENGRATLTKGQQSCMTLYFKRLRKKYGKGIKYYYCGEYGGKKGRPHYHALIFDAPLRAFMTEKDYNAFLVKPWELNGKYRHYDDVWKNGYITIGQITKESTIYTLTYISKKKVVPQYKGDKRQPEYSCMSKGIGASYIDKYRHWHDENPERYTLNLGKARFVMPRYYRDKLYTEQQREQIIDALMEQKMTKRLQMSDKQIQEEAEKNHKVAYENYRKYNTPKKGRLLDDESA